MSSQETELSIDKPKIKNHSNNSKSTNSLYPMNSGTVLNQHKQLNASNKSCKSDINV